MPPARYVLFPTDFSDSAERALSVAMRFAGLLGTGVHLVHVYPARVQIAAAITDGEVSPAPNPEILEGIRRELDALAARVRALGLACETGVIDGDVADSIIAQAGEIDAELIVMGMHRRERFGKAVVESVTHRVLMRTTRPLIAVPPPQAE